MAANPILARTLARKKSEQELEAAIDVLVASMTEPDDVVNSYLEGEGFTMRVKSQQQREQLIETLEAAIELRKGNGVNDSMSHTINFNQRRLST